MLLPWEKTLSRRVVVIGDLILDEYIDGAVSRISPEAPVPVHLVKEIYYRAGGAANTARNIKAIGGKVTLIGLCGKDKEANYLKNILKKDGISISHIIQSPKVQTIVKTRIVSGRQQLLRVDKEEPIEHIEEYESLILQELRQSVCDVLVVSDYGKGLLSDSLLKKLKEYVKINKIFSIIDPKGVDFYKYNWCDILTPNLKEAKEALSHFKKSYSCSFDELGRQVQSLFKLNNLLLTLGSKGLLYLPKNKNQATIYASAKSRDVFDVSGAGDTVVASLSVSVLSEIPMEQVLEIANIAAGIVVEKWGTQSVDKKELEKRLAKNQKTACVDEFLSKNNNKLIEEIHTLKAKDRKIIFTNGCFDILHIGHIDYLEKAKKMGDILVVGLNSDASIRRLKGEQRPINSLEDRKRMLLSLSFVDYVLSFEEDTPLSLIKNISPHILLKGADYQADSIVGAEYVKSIGGSVKTIPLIKGKSTSHLIERIMT